MANKKNVNTNTNANTDNRNEVVTMDKITENSAIKVSGIFNVKSIIKSAENNGLTVTDETRKRLSVLTAKEIGAQLERAKYYFTVKNSAEYLTALGFKTFTEFTEKFDGVADGKSTISEWTSVYTEFIENTEVTKAIALSGKFTLTELVKMLSVKGGNSKTLHGEEFSKEIELFLSANLAYGLKTWGTTKELAEKIKAWNGSVTINSKPTDKSTEGTDKSTDKSTEGTGKPTDKSTEGTGKPTDKSTEGTGKSTEGTGKPADKSTEGTDKSTEGTGKPDNVVYTDYEFDMKQIQNGSLANHLNNVMSSKKAKVKVIVRVYNK